MKFKAKAARRPVMIAAASLLAANVGLSMATGHQSGSATAAVGPLVIAAFSLVAARPLAWLLGRKIPLLWVMYQTVEGLARKVLTAPTFQVAAGGWLAIGWLGILCANAWTAIGRRPAPWLAPWSVLSDPGQAYATGGGVLGAVVLVGGATIAVVLMSRKAKSRPGKDDVHELGLEKLLAPTIGEVRHLMVERGSTEEVTRPYLGDALVKRERLRGIYTTYCMVPLYLADAAGGLGVFGAPGMGKFAHTVANTVLRPGGARTRWDDGHGLGYCGPQILISNTAQIASSIRWRVAVARAALRQGRDGVEPTPEEIRSLVTVYDPTGACRDHADLGPYCKGWSPLTAVSDRASATKLAEGLLTAEFNSTTANAKYFAANAALLVTALLLAASRIDAPLRQVTIWANEIAHANTRVPGTLAKILTRPGADPEDTAAYDTFNALYVSLRDGGDGERSAIWGILRTTLAPFTNAAVQSSTNPKDNLAMVDTTAAVTVPYSVLFVVMPARPSELDSMRPVFTSFLEELIDTALFEATRNDPVEPALPFPLLLTLDEFESTRIMPKLAENLASFTKFNIRIQWITQTYGGLAAMFSQEQMKAVLGNSGAVLTYAGYGATDDHLKNIVEEIGARTVTKISRSKRQGEDAGESESKDRVMLVDVARLKSEVHADQMIVQLSGASRGMNAGREQLRPFILRQRRAVASKTEISQGDWWVDRVMCARLKEGTAAGVVAQDRPSDRRWLRPAQRLYRALVAHTRRPQAVPGEA
jgi:hypothetical protein